MDHGSASRFQFRHFICRPFPLRYPLIRRVFGDGSTLLEVTSDTVRSGTPSDKHTPKDVLDFEFDPEGKLCHFVVSLGNVPSSLETCAGLVARHRVTILSGFHQKSSDSLLWSFFADFAEADISPADLASEIGFLPSSRGVRFKTATRGLLTDSFHFPILLSGERSIVLTTGSLEAIFQQIRGVFGDGAPARVLLFEMGKAAGAAMMKGLVDRLGRSIVRDELQTIMGLYSSSGLGKMHLVSMDFDKETAEVRAYDNFECITFKLSKVPRGSFIRGHITGWFSQLLGSFVEVEERYCVAMGHPFCYFEVKPISSAGP